MHGTRSPAARRRTVTLIATTFTLLGAAACASSKSGETPESTSGNVVRGPEGLGDPASRRGAGGPEGRQNRLFEGITLSDAQRASIDSIRAAYRSRISDRRDRREASDAERAQWRQMMEEQRTAIRNVLTPEQQRKFDENAEAMRRQMRDRPRRGGPPGA